MNKSNDRQKGATIIDENIEVSVIVPCRNEERFIEKCLRSIVNNDYPKNKLEVLLVDGLSEDKTRETIKKYSIRQPYIRLIDNPKKIVSTAMNIGVRHSRGEIIIRMDAHNIYPEDYITKCVYHLKKYSVDNVGGIWITMPGDDTVTAKSIALALAHPFGVGNAYYRVGSNKPQYVDTVPFGCYRQKIFDKIGYFDEELVRNQDDEFNARIIKNKGKILLVPNIKSYYYARESLVKLWRLFYQYGYFKPLVAKKNGSISTWRQLIPAAFVTAVIVLGILSLVSHLFVLNLLVLVLAYSIANAVVSIKLGIKKGMKYLLSLPVAFSVLHFSYGLGYLKGLIDHIILNNMRKRKLHDFPLTR